MKILFTLVGWAVCMAALFALTPYGIYVFDWWQVVAVCGLSAMVSTTWVWTIWKED